MSTESSSLSFDPNVWCDRIGPLRPDSQRQWSVRDIIGPRDACELIHLREMVRDVVSLGRPVPADVFLLSVGEPPLRDCTKIGGLPAWPYDRKWPQSTTGEPLPFLSQFCFRDSMDIVGDLPEDMLLLFGDKDAPSTIIAKWQSSKIGTRWIRRDEVPVVPVPQCFFGSRWRTVNYPDAEFGDPVTLSDGTSVEQVWLVCQLLGMQIGAAPYFPDWGGLPHSEGRAVCSMSAVFPIPDLPWPFMNRSAPLTAHEADHFAVDLCEMKDADGFGVVCVVVGDSGEPIVLFENL
jgi:hypothetical protein